MSLVASAASRFISSALYLTRLAVHRLGLGPVVLAVTAAAALVYSWRTRRPAALDDNNPQQQQQHPNNASRSARHSSSSNPDRPASRPDSHSDRRSRWLQRVRRVTIGSKWSPAHRCDLFCRPQDLEKDHASQPIPDQPDPLPTDALVLRPDLIRPLKKFASMFDLYLIVEVETDAAEQQVTAALKAAGLFEPGLLDHRKLLFCETDLGKASIARQVESHLHVDESVAVVNALQRFVPYVSLVTANAKSLAMPSGSNVTKFTSLAAFRF